MRSSLVVGLVVAATLLVLPLRAHAQDITVSASVTGTVTDSTGGVLPGVTVRGIHEATGNTFETVTDERGTYRLPVRTGVLRVTAVQQGFN
jgi:hypothetical protein